MEFFDFDDAFFALTGNRRLSWQKRLHAQHFEQGKLDTCSVIDIPTGLGKTMVMAIWLIARAQKANVPTRLIYVVDRRTVVDQATDLAEEFAFLLARENAKRFQHVAKRKPKLVERKKKFADTLDALRHGLGIADISLAISTLRGQLADNREWSKNPSRPAIIIGTVDLIGSALLFSGYRSSYKRRPLEAGLLGQDSLLVLDEAHLSKPFDKLLGALEQFSTSHHRGGAVAGIRPLCVIRMSATSRNAKEGVFRLDTDPNSKAFDLWSEHDENGNENNPIKTRFEAKKTLTLVEAEKPIEAIANEAHKLATQKPDSRIVIFVRTPAQVADIRKALEKKNKGHATRIAQLTGTMRGWERDKLVDTETPLGPNDHERRVMQRFLNPDNDTSQGTCFLISTSAGEVGFDLNADHLVGDAAPLDSWIQRLGRVNRRGTGPATVILVVEEELANKTAFDKACSATSTLLADGMDVSPSGLKNWRESLWSELSPQLLQLGVLVVDDLGWVEHRKHCAQQVVRAAWSPDPTTVELTDILLDAWSMTSITEPMPGRPEVGPWLRGIAEWEPPQTTIAWRAELDEPGFGDLDLDVMEEWFDTHRVLVHETLSVPTSFAAKQLLARWSSFDANTQAKLGMSRVVVNRAGIEAPSLADFMKSLERDERQTQKTYDTIRFAELILPASFGGIRRGVGLLDPAEPKLDKDEEKKSSEERNAILKSRQESIDVADIAPGRTRQRIVEATIDGEKQEPRVIGGGAPPKPKTSLRVELESDDAKTVRLISDVARSEKPEWGATKQTLAEHVGLVRQRMDELLNRLDLSDTIKLAARLAAEWHDHGKNRERWQRTVNGTATVGITDWLKQLKLEGTGEHQCLGKSGGAMKRDRRGYRHEFGSLRELTDASNADNLPDEVFDLAMHLIATHHGRGRPHFPKGAFDPDRERQSDQIHTESIRRFARLQRKYGWWHLAWLENLLRCADAMASADQAAEADSAESKGGAA